MCRCLNHWRNLGSVVAAPKFFDLVLEFKQFLMRKRLVHGLLVIFGAEGVFFKLCAVAHDFQNTRLNSHQPAFPPRLLH